MNIYIKITVLSLSLLIGGCSMTFSKDHKVSTPLNTPFSYPYDRAVASSPCTSGTESYQKCLNNSDLSPSMIGRY